MDELNSFQKKLVRKKKPGAYWIDESATYLLFPQENNGLLVAA